MDLENLEKKLEIQTKQINELSKFKHNFLRAEEEIKKLEDEIKALKGEK